MGRRWRASARERADGQNGKHVGIVTTVVADAHQRLSDTDDVWGGVGPSPLLHGSELSLLTLEGAFPACQSIAAGQGCQDCHRSAPIGDLDGCPSELLRRAVVLVRAQLKVA